MLATLLFCAVLFQEPWALASAGTRPEPAVSAQTLEVRGETELSAAAARASAQRAVDEMVRQRYLDRGQQLADHHASFWMPDLMVRRVVDRWLAGSDMSRLIKVVDCDDRRREHDFGHSWQTTMTVAVDNKVANDADRHLRRLLQKEERVMIGKAGATVMLWGVLSLLVWWFDRLTRGYMTGRLRLIGLFLGTALPTLGFLL